MTLGRMFGGGFSKRRREELYLGNFPKKVYGGFAPRDPSTIHDIRMRRGSSYPGIGSSVGGPITYEELVEEAMSRGVSRSEAVKYVQDWMNENGYVVVDGDVVRE